MLPPSPDNAACPRPQTLPPFTFMHIGALAKQVGASPKAIRLYESLGLLGPVSRQGVYRVYSPQQVERVRLIRQAQRLGFRLADMAPALTTGHGEPDWAVLATQVVRHREALAAEVARLQQLDGVLRDIHRDLLECEPAAASQRAPTGRAA